MIQPEEAIEILKKYEYSTKLELSEGIRNRVCKDVTVDDFMNMKTVAMRSLEKDVAKEPLPVNERVGEYYNYICPNDECGKFVDEELHCCDKCGQKLKWE